MMGHSQVSWLIAKRSMLFTFERENGRPESGSAEGSSAARVSPSGARPTAVGESPAGAGPTAVREKKLRDGGSRNFGEMGSGEDAVLIEVGPERGQPDQPRRAGEMGVYPSGEFDGGSGLPSSRLVYKHSPTFSGLKEYFIPWTRDAWNHSKGIGFLVAFVSIPPQYIPVGELEAENAALIQ